jgi:pentatricopeptide repeat protein
MLTRSQQQWPSLTIPNFLQTLPEGDPLQHLSDRDALLARVPLVTSREYCEILFALARHPDNIEALFATIPSPTLPSTKIDTTASSSSTPPMVTATNDVYNTMIELMGWCKRWEVGQLIWDQHHSTITDLTPCASLYLLSKATKDSDVNRIDRLVEHITTRPSFKWDIYLYNTVIRAYVHTQQWHKAEEYFTRLQNDTSVTMDIESYTQLLHACAAQGRFDDFNMVATIS